MLGLAEQIRRAELAVNSVVGDEQGLGRSREEVDADPAKSCRLASATKAFPGPTSISTGAIEAVPSAIAPTAWMPPSE